MSENCVMYILVNKEFLSRMSKGKCAAQVAHSACKASRLAEHTIETSDTYKWWHEWWGGLYTKIILKASEFEIRELMKKYPTLCRETFDEGLTEIPKGSLTTLAFIPMPRDKAPEEIRKLSLL